MFGIGVQGLQIIQRRGRIGQFANALIIFALATAHTAKIEPQYGKAHVVEGVMQIIDQPVVHGAAELWMRVQNDGDRGVFGLLRVIAAFQAAFGAGKYDFGHSCRPLIWRGRVDCISMAP